MSKPKQSRMFETEDLPLFSGAVQSVFLSKIKPNRPTQPILGNCHVCMDTGWVDGHYCWCEAGTALCLHHRFTLEETEVKEAPNV